MSNDALPKTEGSDYMEWPAIGIVLGFVVQLLVFAIGYGALRQQVKGQGDQLDELKRKVQTSNDLRAALVAPMAQVVEGLKDVKESLNKFDTRITDAIKTLSGLCQDLSSRTSHIEGKINEKK